MYGYGVVVAAPGFDENLRLLQGVEGLPIEELVAQPRVEALDVSILPGRARFDESGPGADRGDPFPDHPGDELRAVVRPGARSHQTKRQTFRCRNGAWR